MGLTGGWGGGGSQTGWRAGGGSTTPPVNKAVPFGSGQGPFTPANGGYQFAPGSYGDTRKQAYNAYNTYYAPEMVGLQNQSAAAQGRLGAINNASGAASGAAKAESDIRRKQLDNMLASVGIDINSIPRQTGYLDNMLGITGRAKDANVMLVDQLLGTTDRSFNNTIGDIANTELTQTRRQADDVAARGASSAIGSRWGYEDITKEAQSSRTKAQIARDESVFQLNNRRSNLLLDWEAAQLSTQEQKAKLKDRLGQLKIQADNYKLDQDALAESLKGTLARLNLDGIMSAGSVLDQVSSNNAKQRQMALEIVNMAVAEADKGQQSAFYSPSKTSTKAKFPQLYR